MSLPFYVSPEQFMKDKSDYARKGIKRGKSVMAMDYADGVLFVAENPSSTLHKISEIYDRMAFAGVGKFNEFESLRMHGIRQADVRGTRTPGMTSLPEVWPIPTRRFSGRSSPRP